VKDLNEPQAMNKDLLKHTVELDQMMLPIYLMDIEHAQDQDMLLMYDLDDSVQLVSAAGEMLVELEPPNHFVHGVLECQ
jgi:hypothetical protein